MIHGQKTIKLNVCDYYALKKTCDSRSCPWSKRVGYEASNIITTIRDGVHLAEHPVFGSGFSVTNNGPKRRIEY
jgi:hypothetical protein